MSLDSDGVSKGFLVAVIVLIVFVVALQIVVLVMLFRSVRASKKTSRQQSSSPARSDHYTSVYGSNGDQRDATAFARTLNRKEKSSFQLQPIGDTDTDAHRDPIYDLADSNASQDEYMSMPGVPRGSIFSNISEEDSPTIKPSPRRASSFI
jgi:hypothetical protein